MPITMGPVLGLSQAKGNAWTIEILVATDGAAPPALLKWAGVPCPPPTPLISLPGGATAWRWRHDVILGDQPRTIQYNILGYLPDWADDPDSGAFNVTLPAANTAPNMAFGSCNGFSDPALMKKVANHDDRWQSMMARHIDSPFHLLLMGGDQVYADGLWDALPAFKTWTEKGNRFKTGFTQPMEAQLRKYYFQELYVRRWNRPGARAMFARVPTLMMWDDHDIFDGWGSYPDDQHQSPVYQGIFGIAREYFHAFQKRLAPGERPGGGANPTMTGAYPANYSTLHQIGKIAVLTLDLRSERSNYQVMGVDTWNAVYKALEGLDGCQHLIVVSSIPVVHPDFSGLEALLGALPGQQEMEDDLRDHWHSRPHKAERLRMIRRLLDLSKDTGCRVTFVSGDVHIAAQGVIESARDGLGGNANVINQLTSSALVHPAPPAIAVWGTEHLAQKEEEVDRGVTARMLPLPGSQVRIHAARNWLSLEPDDQGRIWANWWLETKDAKPGSETPFTKVINPVNRVA